MADELARRDIGLVAISYDAPAVLREFAEAKGITFPLLSDAGSRVISELGLLDRDLVAHHERFGIKTQDHQLGVAYPAVFILDQAGRVADKRIGENYRVRESGRTVLEEGLGVHLQPSGRQEQAVGERVTVTVAADSDRYVRWQATRLRVSFEVAPGWHVYGRPIPDGYTPVTVDIASIPEVTSDPPAYPAATPFRVRGLDEQFMVMDGGFEVSVPFAVNVAPGAGDVELAVTVAYQACSDTECLPPRTEHFKVRLEESPPA